MNANPKFLAATAHVDDAAIQPLPKAWIARRKDCEILQGPSSEYGRKRLTDPKLAELRFDLQRKPRRGRCVTQMHYARKGIITPEMEFIAIRENQKMILGLE